jgi:hypothetical protein
MNLRACPEKWLLLSEQSLPECVGRFTDIRGFQNLGCLCIEGSAASHAQRYDSVSETGITHLNPIQ